VFKSLTHLKTGDESMALTHMMDDQNNGKTEGRRQIFTFFVEDMMFGVNIENVLMLGQDVNNIQRLPIEERGFCGVTKLEDRVVPVLDFAHRIGHLSGIDGKHALIESLTNYENSHLDWIRKLEESIKTGNAFTEQTSAKLCEFTNWLSTLKIRDETLAELFNAFQEPHADLHKLVNVLFMFEPDETDKALEYLAVEKIKVLKNLRSLFSRAREQIQSGMRQVLLFVTTDGKTPRYALLIDDINDVIEYKPSDYQRSDQGSLGLLSNIERVINGIYTRKDQPDCLYFDIDKLTDIDRLMAKVS
jgi:chemotaxis signal transduction protein